MKKMIIILSLLTSLPLPVYAMDPLMAQKQRIDELQAERIAAAIRSGNNKEVMNLLNKIKPDKNSLNRFLQDAAKEGNVDIARLLLNIGADLESLKNEIEGWANGPRTDKAIQVYEKLESEA